MAQADYKNFLHFLGAFFLSALVFAASLATLLVLLTPKGLRILQHGIPMCGLLAQNNMLDRLLYTSCGCALVEIILIPLALLGLRYFTPHLLRQFAYAHAHGRKLARRRLAPPESPSEGAGDS